MTKLDDRTIANIVALEKACRVFPNGGDHESRKYIAQKLKLCAKKGNVTLGGLDTIAHSAVQELSKAKLGLAAMSSNDLIGLAILSCTDALEALNNALASADLESAHEFIEQAKGHLLMIRTRSARHIFTDDQLDSFEPKDFSNAVNSRERALQVCPVDQKLENKKRTPPH
jgi:hypothetical protein